MVLQVGDFKIQEFFRMNIKAFGKFKNRRQGNIEFPMLNLGNIAIIQ